MTLQSLRPAAISGVLGFVLAACSSSSTASAPVSNPSGSDAGPTLTDDQYRAAAVQGMHDSLLKDLDALALAAMELQNAAPTPSGRGWDPVMDAVAITAMKAAWLKARSAYEHEEGAIAPLFPDIDFSIDARYDDFMTQLLNVNGDSYLFDGQGVIGMHAIERILYVPETPAFVVGFESKLPGYKAAAFPATEQEAADFKNKLCPQLISDIKALRDQWKPAKINVAIAFQGLILLMNEQREKVSKAASTEEESRYSQRTLADMRGNLDGTKAVYSIFQPWLLSKRNAGDPNKDGPTIDGKIEAGFATLAQTYGQVQGDAVPQPPPTWSTVSPSAADLASPFGKLYSQVRTAVDPNTDGTVVFEMNDAATVLGFPLVQR